jgi:hypothetical protein
MSAWRTIWSSTFDEHVIISTEAVTAEPGMTPEWRAGSKSLSTFAAVMPSEGSFIIAVVATAPRWSNSRKLSETTLGGQY